MPGRHRGPPGADLPMTGAGPDRIARGSRPCGSGTGLSWHPGNGKGLVPEHLEPPDAIRKPPEATWDCRVANPDFIASVNPENLAGAACLQKSGVAQVGQVCFLAA